MERNKKRILINVSIIATVIIIAVATPLLLGLTKVADFELTVNYPDNSVIIEKTEIYKDLTAKYGDFKQYRRNQIKTEEIKNFLEENDFISHTTVSVSLTGILRITIEQKQILARVYTMKGRQYYIDSEKNIIDALHTKQTAQCIIVNGKINENPSSVIDTVKDKVFYSIYILTEKIKKDSVLKENIAEIRIEKKQWYLLPVQDDYTITLGEESDWDNELKKLHYLLENIAGTEEVTQYENIDLRYHNQAICRKRNND